MTYQGFEDLPVWNTATEWAESCEDFLSSAEDRISRAESLQNSPIKGQRLPNNAERHRREHKKKPGTFLEEFNATLPDGHRAKKSPKRP